jgi:hypothetical protein
MVSLEESRFGESRYLVGRLEVDLGHLEVSPARPRKNYARRAWLVICKTCFDVWIGKLSPESQKVEEKETYLIVDCILLISTVMVFNDL